MIGLLLSAGVLGLQSSHAATSHTIYANIDADGNIRVSYADGTPIGSAVPPGSYQVVLNNNSLDDLGVAHQFHLFGPGVDVSGAQSVQSTWNVTFQSGATYTYQDDLSPSTSKMTFLATTASAGVTPTTSPASPSTPSGSKTPKPTSSDVVGSAIVPFRGTLDGIVSSAGKLTLTFKSKNVATLKAGKYTIAVDDLTTKSGFVVQRIRAFPITVTSPVFVGKHSVSAVLKAGQWWFSSPAGTKHYFIVIA